MKREKWTLGVLAVAFVFLAAGSGLLYSEYRTENRARRQYESLAELAREGEAVETEERVPAAETNGTYVSPIRFEELQRINPDIVGWLKIEGTVIDYPIVQTDNNETYLETDFEGNKSETGAVFLDYESEPDFSGRHNILYGHHMKNGSMFKDIIKYKDETFFKEHQKITVYTPEREYHLRPVTALYTDSSAVRRKTAFETEESFQAYVEEMTKGGSFLQLPEEPVEQLWSFVTCSYEFDDARTILYAGEVPPG
ncbi:class B sortase [Lachnospiraceae bacterium 54-53]